MKFLVVDDSPLSRRMMRKALEELGHTATEASDGTQGIERYFLEKPDYVILDLVMPGLTGFEVLENLRKLDPAARVIICSADIQQSTRETVLKGGALGLMNKPVTAAQIADVLTSVN
jgi:two-component system, chemotaxis family, chemotaxis protein CheY